MKTRGYPLGGRGGASIVFRVRSGLGYRSFDQVFKDPECFCDLPDFKDVFAFGIWCSSGTMTRAVLRRFSS